MATLATTDQVNWIKIYSADTISAGLGSFAASTIQFCRRHPEYHSNPAYRPGFAHDLGRHFTRLAKRRKVGVAWRDARQLAKELGWWRFLTLTIGGIGHFKERRRSIRAGTQDASAPRR